MLAPKKSLRPKARPKSIYGVGEKSTQSPDGLTIAEREKKARDSKRRKDVFERRAANRAGAKIDSDAKAASSSRMKSKEKKSDDIFNMMMEAATELEKKSYGGKMKKPVAMKSGGKMPMVKKGGKSVPAFAADGVGKMRYGGKMPKKMAMGGKMGKCRGMGAATRGGNFKMG